MARTMFISRSLGFALVLGCGGGKGDETGATVGATPGSGSDDGTTGAVATGGGSETGGPGSAGDTTTLEPTTTGVPSTSGETMAGETEDTCGFLCPTTGTGEGQCDVFGQDCPEGEKCAAYIEGGASAWNATKCVPVTGEGVPGDACSAEGGGGSGFDDCQKGAFCWDVDMESKGVCVELCGGSEASPTCPDEAAFHCVVVNEGVLNLCLSVCDPLVQDCVGDDLCIPSDDNFVCAPDASGEEGQAFDPCEFANVCDKGLLCLAPSAGMECDPNSGGCCLPMCDLADPDVVCPGKGQSCTSIYEEGMAPPDFETVGFCVIPE